MDSDTNGPLSAKDKSRKLQGICLASFVVTAITLVGITLALVPAVSRSGWFWLRLVWMTLLSALCWGSVHGFLRSSLSGNLSQNGIGGLVPARFMVVFWYSVASIGLMVTQALLTGTEWVWRLHLAVQIGMGGIVAIVLLLMLVPLLQSERDKRRSTSSF